MFVFCCSQVCADLPVRSVIMSMFAKDLDAGENGTVTFLLREGKPMVQYIHKYNTYNTYSTC